MALVVDVDQACLRHAGCLLGAVPALEAPGYCQTSLSGRVGCSVDPEFVNEVLRAYMQAHRAGRLNLTASSVECPPFREAAAKGWGTPASSIPSSSRLWRAHFLPQMFFLFVGPIATIEAEEDGRVGDCHAGLQDEDMESFPGFVEFGDDLLVQERLALEAAGVEFVEEMVQRIAVVGDARRVIFGNDFQFCVGEYDGTKMLCLGDDMQHLADDVELVGVGFDGLDALAGLQRVGGVDDGDPVAMAEEREFLREARVPVFLSSS